MNWAGKIYEDLNEFEKFKADKLIEKALDSTSDYKGEAPSEHDRMVIENYIREHLELLDRASNKLKKD